MHMADALLSPTVGGAMLAVSGGAIAYSVTKIKKDELDDKKVPMMGVMGAFVFAAQMINFTIPATGSSGHIAGGILLAALLGPLPAFLTLAAVLVIQALFFADGGLLALGCNIFNMGFYACFVTYPLIFKPLVKGGFTAKRITLASLAAAIISLQLGAFSVVMETLASGITQLPFGAFVALMQPIHLAIGAVEGAITAAILCYVNQARPELLESAAGFSPMGHASVKRVGAVFLVMAVLVAGGLSLFASANPDGLEWSMEHVAGTTELTAKGKAYDLARSIQEKTAIMPDYSFKSQPEESTPSGTSTAGLVGGAATLVLAGLAGWGISVVKKKKRTAPAGKMSR